MFILSNRLSRTQKMVLCALMVATSILLGKVLAFTAGPFRISFENLSLLLAGILLGPGYGMLTAVAADLVGCALVGYAINPIITLGAAALGLTAGLISRALPPTSLKNLLVCCLCAHVLGSMLIKSIGLHVFLGYPPSLLVLRVPLYLIIGSVESYFIRLVCRALSPQAAREGRVKS